MQLKDEVPAGARLKPGAARHAIARMRQALARAVHGDAISSKEVDDVADDEIPPDDEITQKVLIPKAFFSKEDGGSERG
jgi:hypothetical protein